MPGGDGTGPGGMGPMTGRAAGYCAGYPVPGYMNPIPRMGMGWGRGYMAPWYGFGARWGPGYAGYGTTWPMTAPAFAPWIQPGSAYGMTKEQETDLLKNQAQVLGQQLDQINKRIQELAESEK